jgi:hypothetical protein
MLGADQSGKVTRRGWPWPNQWNAGKTDTRGSFPILIRKSLPSLRLTTSRPACDFGFIPPTGYPILWLFLRLHRWQTTCAAGRPLTDRLPLPVVASSPLHRLHCLHRLQTASGQAMQAGPPAAARGCEPCTPCTVCIARGDRLRCLHRLHRLPRLPLATRNLCTSKSHSLGGEISRTLPSLQP